MTRRTTAPASFRDRSGYVFFEDGQPFRCVNESYRQEFEALKSTGLLEELQTDGMLVSHEEVGFEHLDFPGAFAVLKPRRIELVSYPYEWCFGQLKDAALLTLDIQLRALRRGMTLKDASAYNVQFSGGRPVFIDTLSFERRVEGEPWVAYRQFCQHFLAPLALVAYVDPELGRLSRNLIDGVPLSVASKLLPLRARVRPGIAMHLSAHSRAVAPVWTSAGPARMSGTSLMALIDSLVSTVSSIKCKPPASQWSNYYDETNYSGRAAGSKERAVAEAVGTVRPRIVWDLGANTGAYSRIAAEESSFVAAWDMDPGAVDLHYKGLQGQRRSNVLPLVTDLTNPSPALGWAHAERDSFLDRSNADLALALALVHHLAIGNNVPLTSIADFLSNVAPSLLVEFVPKSDSQVQRMLSSRRDVFPDYTQGAFESSFGRSFKIVRSWPIEDSERTVYLMERHAS